MKTLIFSDSHLTDAFDEKKYQLLKRIITSTDRVIINGDFWDGYVTTFDKFINSPWKKLFPLLKSKKTIYIFGNHDKRQYADKRFSLFSVEQKDRHILHLLSHTLIIEHGNLIYPVFDDTILKLRSLNKLAILLISPILRRLHFLTYFNKRANRLIKKKIQLRRASHEIHIMGHTHIPHHDMKAGYINSGDIQRGEAEYLVIDNGKIIPHQETY